VKNPHHPSYTNPLNPSPVDPDAMIVLVRRQAVADADGRVRAAQRNVDAYSRDQGYRERLDEAQRALVAAKARLAEVA